MWIVVAASAVLGVFVYLSSGDKTYGEDPHMWLEEISSPEALEWAKTKNTTSYQVLQGDALYRSLEAELRPIFFAEDRLPSVSLNEGYIYNFWQDDKHIRGIWRRARISEYRRSRPRWEVLLDIDKLSKEEEQNWVWKGGRCLHSDANRCLVSLSDGGKDAVVVREYNLATKAFVDDGFTLSEAKSRVAWLDKNHLLVATDFGEGSLTNSGYPRILRKWQRGQDLNKSPVVLEGRQEDVSVWAQTFIDGNDIYHIVSVAHDFYTSSKYLLKNDGSLDTLPIPEDSYVYTLHQGQLLFSNLKNWSRNDREFLSGSLLSLDLSNKEKAMPQVVYQPTERSSLSSVRKTDQSIYLDVLDNVEGQILRGRRGEQGQWVLEPVRVPRLGSVSLEATDPRGKELIFRYQNFLTPPRQYLFDEGNLSLVTLKEQVARYDSSQLTVEQHEATSADEVRIPYFVVRPKNLNFDGTAPTLLYGYGGFLISQKPFYSGVTGKAWLEKGGVYVVANIRGGGEFGPRWHQAALKENRQKAFDDFIAIAEDLIKRQITSPERLGMMGGSNGGLLVGAVMTQRPDLFNAVVCQVPLLDMLRYHKLLAGASWMAEYGDPDNPAMRSVIKKYSPYHNVQKTKEYPKPFFFTSTLDDRVHPGHARKMVARMEKQGHPVLYYENIEGGHSGAANLEQRLKVWTMSFVYLYQQLMSSPEEAVSARFDKRVGE